MFEKTLGARAGARASALGKDFKLQTKTNVAPILLAIVGLAAAILFFAWLTLPDSIRPEITGPAAGSDCASLGRGGVYCAKHPISDGQSNAAVGQENNCAYLGKGGRVCTEHP